LLKRQESFKKKIQKKKSKFTFLVAGWRSSAAGGGSSHYITIVAMSDTEDNVKDKDETKDEEEDKDDKPKAPKKFKFFELKKWAAVCSWSYVRKGKIEGQKKMEKGEEGGGRTWTSPISCSALFLLFSLLFNSIVE